MCRYGKNCGRSRRQKSVLMLQSIWYTRRRKILPGLILTFVFRRCRLISAGRRSSMHLEVYLRMRPGWNSGRKTGKLTGKPRLSCENHAMPVFYRDVMYREGGEGKDEAYLKLYDGHDWKWFRVCLKHTDMEYLRRNWKGKKASAPTLEKRQRRYFLRFFYTEEVTLTKTPVEEQIICSVDLGINTDAVCTIMRSDGTVLGRKFINFPSEKDRMYRVLGRIRRFQREHGSAQAGGKMGVCQPPERRISVGRSPGQSALMQKKTMSDVIVFEYLEMQGKIAGNKKQKLHLWRKRDIQKRCEHQAHRKGMRVSRICAWNTSRLAYDGSGAVLRDGKNHSLCTFSDRKKISL